METIFISTGNSKTNESKRFRYYFTDKLNLKNNKTIALVNLSIYFTWENVKSEYKNNKFKITAPTWSEEFNISDGSYAVTDIQDYFEYIIKNHETITDDDSPINICANKIKNSIAFKINTGYKLELLTKETMQLLGSSKEEIGQDKDGELVPKIEKVDVALIHCNIVNNINQQKSRVLYSFVPDKQFGKLINVEPQLLIMLKTTSAKFSFIEIWFTNQNNTDFKKYKFYKILERG